MDQSFFLYIMDWNTLPFLAMPMVSHVEVLATLKKLANWLRLEKMVRELHQGTRLTKCMFPCMKSKLL